jgi:hypothetical protein
MTAIDRETYVLSLRFFGLALNDPKERQPSNIIELENNKENDNKPGGAPSLGLF